MSLSSPSYSPSGEDQQRPRVFIVTWKPSQEPQPPFPFREQPRLNGRQLAVWDEAFPRGARPANIIGLLRHREVNGTSLGIARRRRVPRVPSSTRPAAPVWRCEQDVGSFPHHSCCLHEPDGILYGVGLIGAQHRLYLSFFKRHISRCYQFYCEKRSCWQWSHGWLNSTKIQRVFYIVSEGSVTCPSVPKRLKR